MSGDDDSSGWQLTESDPGVFTCVLALTFTCFTRQLLLMIGSAPPQRASQVARRTARRR
jgi:hypothetical protein